MDEQQLQRILGYRFVDSERLKVALTHRSAGRQNNERLEFFGDAILGFLIAEQLFAAHPDAVEGDLSRLRTRLVRGETLAEVARSLRLSEAIIVGPGELKSGGYRRDSVLADAVEALIAAIYLDGGIEAARAAVKRWMGELMTALQAPSDLRDPKTRLQELLQAEAMALPEYRLLGTEGEQHEQHFAVRAELVELDLHADGSGSSRRRAEQAAAESLLLSLMERGIGRRRRSRK